VAVYAIYNPATGTKALLGVNATGAAVPEVYGGANMPAGYTASALISVWPTNASQQFVVASQRDRKVKRLPAGSAAIPGTLPTTPTSLSIASGVPLNAVMAYGFAGAAAGSVSTAATYIVFIGGDATGSAGGIGAQQISGYSALGGGFGGAWEAPMLTPQTIYYLSNASSGYTLSIQISAYEF
jgi:hypothetical protein